MDEGAKFQASSSAQGKHYENHVRFVLAQRGWTAVSDRPTKVAGGEVDIVALDPDGRLWWIECKGSYKDQPGCERLDTVKKALATAWVLRQLNPDRPAYMLATTNKPKAGSAGEQHLSLALFCGLFDRVEVI